jgi:hypothetical protein
VGIPGKPPDETEVPTLIVIGVIILIIICLKTCGGS